MRVRGLAVLALLALVDPTRAGAERCPLEDAFGRECATYGGLRLAESAKGVARKAAANAREAAAAPGGAREAALREVLRPSTPGWRSWTDGPFRFERGLPDPVTRYPVEAILPVSARDGRTVVVVLSGSAWYREQVLRVFEQVETQAPGGASRLHAREFSRCLLSYSKRRLSSVEWRRPQPDGSFSFRRSVLADPAFPLRFRPRGEAELDDVVGIAGAFDLLTGNEVP